MENDPVRFIVVYDQDAASGQLSRRHDSQRGGRLFEEVGGGPECTAASLLADDADVAAHLLD
jgi:hypothetical protein